MQRDTKECKSFSSSLDFEHGLWELHGSSEHAVAAKVPSGGCSRSAFRVLPHPPLVPPSPWCCCSPACRQRSRDGCLGGSQMDPLVCSSFVTRVVISSCMGLRLVKGYRNSHQEHRLLMLTLLQVHSICFQIWDEECVPVLLKHSCHHSSDNRAICFRQNQWSYSRLGFYRLPGVLLSPSRAVTWGAAPLLRASMSLHVAMQQVRCRNWSHWNTASCWLHFCLSLVLSLVPRTARLCWHKRGMRGWCSNQEREQQALYKPVLTMKEGLELPS